MPILDLSGAKRASSEMWPKRGKRNLNPNNANALMGGYAYGGSGGFAAGKINRLTSDFLASQRSADQDLFGDNIRLRTRARKLAVDNFLARKFLQMVVQNVVGSQGVLMRPKVVGINGKETAQTEKINQRIAEEWKKWTRRGRCTADGKLSFVALQQQAIRNVAREGENLAKLVYGRGFNECAMAVQPLDNDQLDDLMITTLPGGNTVRMGVEVNRYMRPIAYHLWNGHPYDVLGTQNREKKRVEADQVVHTAIWERPAQTRGYTWLAAAMLEMNQYGRYEEAVVVASRASAAKFATIEKAYPEGYVGEDEDSEGSDRNTDGTELMTANAGELLDLDYGETLNYTDPRFPTSTTKEFTQTILRNIASGLLVSYPSLANDLEGVNFSSIRAGLVDERDCWRVIQAWFITDFLDPIYQAWLKMALLTTLTDFTLTPDQMEQVEWRPRGWEWVDPQKDAQSTVLKLGEGLSTFEIECGNRGLLWTDVVDQRAIEQAYMKKKGVQFGVDITGDQAGKGVAAGAEDDVQADAKAGASNTEDQNANDSGKGAKGKGGK